MDFFLILISTLVFIFMCVAVESFYPNWGIALAVILTWPHAMFWALRIVTGKH